MKERLTSYELKVRKGIQQSRAKGEFKFQPQEQAAKYGEWAKAQLKDSRITLRISGQDLGAIKSLAAKAGKKYQTYLGEMIHREAQKAA
jgi:predicted DNA binding CopG/RHH family protein